MSDEPTPGGQAEAGGAAQEAQPFDPASVEVEVGGRNMTVENLQKSYLEAENRMRESDNRFQEANRKLEGLSWTDEVINMYNGNADFRAQMDNYLGGGGGEAGQQTQAIHGLHPLTQQLNQQQQELAQIKHERQFDSLRGAGYEVSKDDELAVLTVIATNPNIQDVKAAYLDAFAQREIARARDGAAETTAANINRARGTYAPAPKGKTSAPAKPDVSKMSESERDAYAIDRISKELFD